MPEIYKDHGIHGWSTYEEACEVAKRTFQSGWIFEYPGYGYERGWHFIVSDFKHYCAQGYIPRAEVKVHQTIEPRWTGGVLVNKESQQ